MSNETPKKKIKFEDDSYTEVFSKNLCTSLVLGLDISYFYNTLGPFYRAFITQTSGDIAQVINRVLEDEVYAKWCENNIVEACTEMLAKESATNIIHEIQNAAFRVFLAKNGLNSDQDYSQSLMDIDREIEREMNELKGLITAKSVLERKSSELQNIKQNLEKLCQESKVLKRVQSS